MKYFYKNVWLIQIFFVPLHRQSGKKSTLSREDFYSPTGETIKAIEWGADGSPKLIRKMEAEDGRGQTKREDVRRHNEPKNLDMKHR